MRKARGEVPRLLLLQISHLIPRSSPPPASTSSWNSCAASASPSIATRPGSPRKLPAAQDDELPAVSDALEQLAAEDQGLADLVKLKFFVGMTNKDVAELLGVSGPTVERRWALARAWMFRVLRE